MESSEGEGVRPSHMPMEAQLHGVQGVYDGGWVLRLVVVGGWRGWGAAAVAQERVAAHTTVASGRSTAVATRASQPPASRWKPRAITSKSVTWLGLGLGLGLG